MTCSAIARAGSYFFQFTFLGDPSAGLKSALDDVLLFVAYVRKPLNDLIVPRARKAAQEAAGKAHGLPGAELWGHGLPPEHPTRV